MSLSEDQAMVLFWRAVRTSLYEETTPPVEPRKTWLTDDERAEIRSLRAQGEQQAFVARLYGVSRSTVRRVERAAA